MTEQKEKWDGDKYANFFEFIWKERSLKLMTLSGDHSTRMRYRYREPGMNAPGAQGIDVKDD